jgi:transcriptional pleiotropic regulator of transition state genes
MKSTGIVRLVDELGRIVLPKELRTVLNIREGDAIEFFYDERTMMLRKYRTTSCIFCDNLDAIYFKEKFVCRSCINAATGGITMKVAELAVENYLSAEQEHTRRISEVFGKKPIKTRRRQKNEEMFALIDEAVAKDPNVKQKELVHILGVSQSRVSQLMRLYAQLKPAPQV